MKIEIAPQETTRAEAYELWMTSPMPMVTLTKTFNVTRLLKASKRNGVKFNTLLCWCIGKAASGIKEFYILPEKDKLFKYDSIAVNVIVNNNKGGINSCDIAFNNDIQEFAKEYDRLTIQVANECKSSFIDNSMIIGTSAMIQTQLDSIVNQYTDKFCNPMVMWGKYRRTWLKTILPISFQFHHVQMDGGHGANFLEQLQRVINEL
ncbi:MAG: chloramphenicol acetyltransferase [Bacteroidaceae bacterium]|nr:chloramphenicol acetyltransferase [Bacteroidaceae bacterium]